MTREVFICHASEDKETVAIPLSEYLTEHGVSVWLDINELTIGDSLRSAIDRGLSHARFGVVIISPDSTRKVWPNRELGAMFALEQSVESKMILPVWHNITPAEVLSFSPMLADRLSVSTSDGIAKVGAAVLRAIQQPAQPAPFSPSRQHREETLSNLHRRLLTADGRNEIRRIELEIEAFRERYPQDVDARILSEHAEKARHREEARDISLGSPAPAYRMHRSSLLALILRWALFLGAGVGAYYLLRWIFF